MEKKRKYIYALACLLLLTGICACSDEADEERQLTPGNNLVLAMTRSNQDIVNNTTVYRFNTSWNYMQKVQEVAYRTDELAMKMDAGTWNLALVTGENLNPSSITSPVSGQGRNGVMWQTQPASNVLPSMPELRTAYIENQTVAANTTRNASATLYRNVAKVRVFIEKTRGLDPAGTHTLKINGVPTSLNWAGGLYPNKNTPAVSTSPLKGTFRMHNKASDINFQESDTLEFIVPAHKGSDYLSASPQDTTTHKLNLSVDLACAGGTRFTKNNVAISQVPRVNSILEIHLSMQGELNVNASVLDWKEVAVNVNLDDYTELMVSKAKVELAHKDTVYVNTNADDFSIAPENGVSWMTVRRIGTTNAVEITADPASYIDNTPRSSYFTVTARHVVKKIPVRQRPEEGTITAPESFWVSPSTGNTTRTITVNSKGPWVMTTPNPATVTPSITSGGEGNTDIVFTRKAHTGVVTDYSPYYGNSVFNIKNTQTLEIITVTAQNLFLEVDDMDVPNAIGTNTKENLGKITCLGGTETSSVVTRPTWITSATINQSTGNITLVAQGEPTGERREGTITLCHSDDPSYTATVKVIQDFLITIPPFDYFVIKFTWNTNDIDIKVQFEGNNMSYDGEPFTGAANTNNKWVGYNKLTQFYNGSTLLQWGTDATGGEGETVFFNAPVIDNDSSSPRFVRLAAYCYWYKLTSSANVGQPVRATIFAYEGGTMKKVGTNFINEGGIMLYSSSKQQQVNASGNNKILNPDKLVKIVYDRIKHSANIQFVGTELNTPLIPTPNQ